MRVRDADCCADSAPIGSTMLLEPLPVLPRLDGVDVGADQLDAVLLEHAGLVQGHRGVERGLAAEGGQQRVGPLLLDDLRDDLGRDRLDVGRVGELGVGHDRRRVGVDQDDAHALLPQHPAGLRAGVVELAGLADDDRPGADDQHARDVVALRHQRRPSSKVAEPVEQVGRVVRAGRGLRVVLHREGRHVVAAQPLDHVVVEADVADTSAAPYGVSNGPSSGASTAKPWLCAVTSTLPVGAVLHRLVDAAVAVAQLVGAEAERAAEHLVAEADPEDGDPASEQVAPSARRRGRRWPGRRGRWRGTRRPRRSRSTSSTVDVDGSTCTSMPRSAIRSGVIRLMPRSSAATVNRFSPVAGTT